jgi:lipopolysaccharide export system protein LptA
MRIAVCSAMWIWLAWFVPVSYADLVDDLEDLEGSGSKSGPTTQPTEPEQSTPPSQPEQEPRGEEPAETAPTQPVQAPLPATPGKKPPKRSNAKEPVYFRSSDKATYSRDGGLINLEKNVVIEQGSVTFRADKAVVHMARSESNPGSDVEKVIVTGHVRMNKSDSDPAEQMSATGEEAIFLNTRQTVTLIGDAKVIKGGNVVRGKKITYHLDSGKIVVDQAEGTVKPGETKK